MNTVRKIRERADLFFNNYLRLHLILCK
jgi:hypothetical protein